MYIHMHNTTQRNKSVIFIIGIIYFLVCPFVCSSSEEVKTRSEKHFVATQNIHARLDTYKKELIYFQDDYLYREDRLPLDELMLQLFPVFVEAIDKTRHNVWTINRLLYAEIFHERLDHYSPRAVEVITTYIKTTIDFMTTDITSLEEIPQKAPSLTDIPLLNDHYHKTINQLQLTKTKLHEILIAIEPDIGARGGTLQEIEPHTSAPHDKESRVEPLHI